MNNDHAGNTASTKIFWNLPCAHRNHHDADGHCSHVHGYSRSFHFKFACSELTPHGFVVDFGGLKAVKQYLEHMFDHTLLINPDDPLMPNFSMLEERGGCSLRVMKYGVGMEDTAREVFEEVQAMLDKLTEGRAWIVSVECRENDKNSGLYFNPHASQVPPFTHTPPEPVDFDDGIPF